MNTFLILLIVYDFGLVMGGLMGGITVNNLYLDKLEKKKINGEKLK